MSRGEVMTKKSQHKAKTHESHAHASHKSTKNTNKGESTTVIKTVVITAIVVLFLVWVIPQLWNAVGSGMVKEPTTTTGDGVVTIVEYSDFECPFCARALPTLEQVKNTYGDMVVIEYKHFPLSFHPNAQKAAEASECARDQGEFWPYHDILFANQDALTVPDLKGYAADLGLDTNTFNSCLDSGEKAGIVAADMAEGRAFGVTGTPAFNIGGELLVGAQPFSAFKEIIDRKLAEGGGDVVVPEPADDPTVQLTVIDDPSCGVCDAERVVELTQTELFPTAEVTRLNKDDPEAQALIAELELTALPAYIFDESVTQTANYAQVQGALIVSGDKYVIAPGAAGSVKLLNPIDTAGRPMKGDADAPVTIIEFSDFECPFCKKFVDEAYQQLLNTYVADGEANIVFMHFPLSFHPNAENAGIATECAFEQNMFWEYHDILFENQNALTVTALKGYAADIGLDQTQFDSCLDSRKYADQVAQDMAVGQANGISGTPGFIINGIGLSGALPFESFQTVIDAELN